RRLVYVPARAPPGTFSLSLHDALPILAAGAVYAFWRIHDPARAFEVTLALLVVSCPCALSLAVPATLAAAHGALAKLGVLVDVRSEEHTSELQSRENLVCRLLLEKKKR